MDGLSKRMVSRRVLTSQSSDDLKPRAITSDGILSALASPLFVVDKNDGITFLNSAAEQFFHFSAAGLSGANLQDLVPHDSPMLSLIHKVRRSESSMSQYGVVISTPRIGEHQVDIDSSPVGDARR